MNEGLGGRICFDCRFFPRVKFPQGEDLQCHEQTKRIQDDLLHCVGQLAQGHDLLTLLNAVEQEFGGLCCMEGALEECNVCKEHQRQWLPIQILHLGEDNLN